MLWTRAEFLVNKVQRFPYYLNENFINDNEESVFQFQEIVLEMKKSVSSCKKS